MKKLLTLLALLVAGEMTAQTYDDEYHPYDYPEAEAPMIQIDSSLFYRAIQNSDDVYGQLSAFTLPDVAVHRRGLSFRDERTFLHGMPLNYRYAGILRRMGAEERTGSGTASLERMTDGLGGVQSFGFGDALPLRSYRASVNFSGRNYLMGANFSLQREIGNDMVCSFAADVRTGRDLYVDGVFTNRATVGFRLKKTLAERHSFALLCILPPELKGTRLATVDEAFALTGDYLYNPVWGFQDGKVRNARVRREFVPLLMAEGESRLSASTSLHVVAGGEMGIRKYSMPGWYDARTPMPDNYRYMPSFTGEQETEQAWLAGDARYTQIRWDEMIRQNRMGGGHAVYALEDKVERVTNLYLGADFSTRIDRRLRLNYGVKYTVSLSRNYKTMRDLLGATHIVDIDRFLIDDATYSAQLENDLRHPQRVIKEGDRFGYDYRLHHRSIKGYITAEYRVDRFRADVSAVLADDVVFRRGYMEKELFAGSASYGRSRKLHFRPYVVRGVAGWAFTPHSYLELACAAGARTPDAEMLFVQPMYNNRTVADPQVERYYAAEVNWKYAGRTADLRVTAYAQAHYDRMVTRRYFDDLSRQYCDVTAAGIACSSVGMEAAVLLRLSYRWQLSLTAAGGISDYIRDPSVTVIADAGNAMIDENAVSHMGDCHVGEAPQLAATAEISHFSRRGWGFRFSAGYVAGRYIEPSMVRRTDRIARGCGNVPEILQQIMTQERLDDVFSARVSVFKSFYFERSRLTAYAMLGNLSGRKDMVYHGFESMRMQHVRAGDMDLWRPHASRYTCSYPRMLYLSVSYQF